MKKWWNNFLQMHSGRSFFRLFVYLIVLLVGLILTSIFDFFKYIFDCASVFFDEMGYKIWEFTTPIGDWALRKKK